MQGQFSDMSKTVLLSALLTLESWVWHGYRINVRQWKQQPSSAQSQTPLGLASDGTSGLVCRMLVYSSSTHSACSTPFQNIALNTDMSYLLYFIWQTYYAKTLLVPR